MVDSRDNEGMLVGPNGERRSTDPVEAMMQTMRAATGEDTSERPARSFRVEMDGAGTEVDKRRDTPVPALSQPRTGSILACQWRH